MKYVGAVIDAITPMFVSQTTPKWLWVLLPWKVITQFQPDRFSSARACSLHVAGCVLLSWGCGFVCALAVQLNLVDHCGCLH